MRHALVEVRAEVEADEASPAQAGWHAALALGFERRGERSVLASRQQSGPLVVQKALYPEGGDVCHVVVLHPPAGIAGGDRLRIEARAGDGARALLTTPGAGKWYRSAGAKAAQHVSLEVGEGATLEWLPQETIVFDAALAGLHTDIRLAPTARFLGWEILCLGRTGSGERFTRGECRLDTTMRCGDVLLWRERGRIAGGSRLLESPAGLAGHPVCGTLLASAPQIDDALLAQCRALAPREGEGALTRLPRLLVARYLGDSSEAAKLYFAALRRLLRPALLGLPANDPRIWNT